MPKIIAGWFLLATFTAIAQPGLRSAAKKIGPLENYTGIWLDEGGSFGVIVGTAGTILHWDGDDWFPISSPTGNDLYDVHGLAPDNVVASGQDVILRWDGMSWSIILQNPSTPYTPVFLTQYRIWYGIPSNQFPIVGRCNLNGSSPLGLVTGTGSVLNFQQENGLMYFIGSAGDIVQTDNTLIFNFVFDQDDMNPLGFAAADFFLQTSKREGMTAYAGNQTGIYQLEEDWNFITALTELFGARAIRNQSNQIKLLCAGLDPGGNGFTLSIENGTITQTFPPEATGIGLSDVDEVTQDIFSTVPGHETCLIGTGAAQFFIGDLETILRYELCMLAFQSWLIACSETTTPINLVDFIIAVNNCQSLNQ